jgi:hypothetical protein
MRASLALPSVAAFAFFLAGCHSPPASNVGPPAPNAVRLLVGGDSRNDSSHVTPWAFREAVARSASAFLFLGDMELTPSMDSHFARELEALGAVPFFPVLGNHEVKTFGFMGLRQGQAEDAFRARFLRTPRTPVTSSIPGKVVYSVDLPGSVHFVALDNVSQRGFGADQLAWLAADLDAVRRTGGPKYILVGMHKPLAKNGVAKHGMDADGEPAVAESDAALALFEKAKVSMILASHVHEYAAFTQGGIPSYITGGLGAPLVGSAGPEHAFHHFLQLDVSDEAVRVTVVRFDGAPCLEVEPENE